MEVRQQRLYRFKFESCFGIWVDEEVGRCRAGDDFPCAGSNGMFERANRCGTDGDDATGAAESLIDG